MSSNAVPAVRFFLALVCCVGLAISPGAVAAQDDAGVTQDEDEDAASAAPPRPFGGLDLSVTVPRNESDRLIEEDCAREADAGKVAGEIVVCRTLGEASDGSWDKEEWERRYAQETAFKDAPRTPNTFGIPNHGNSIGFGSVPPPALMIDIEALPEPPAGSDADRIARGLPPLGKYAEPSAEEIAARRRALGLDAPPLPEPPE